MIKLSQLEDVLEPHDRREGEDPLSDSPHRYAAAAGVSDPPASALPFLPFSPANVIVLAF